MRTDATPSLFDPRPGLWRRTAPATSREAARAITPVSGEQRRRVYEFIKSRGAHGATDQEVQRALDLSPQSECPRRRELERAGAISDSGRRRATDSGRAAVVWVATDAGGGA